MRFEQMMATRSPALDAGRAQCAGKPRGSLACLRRRSMSCRRRMTRRRCPNRSAWRVSIAGSVRSAGANDCRAARSAVAHSCGKIYDARAKLQTSWRSVHLAAEIACDDARVVDEARSPGRCERLTAGFENVAIVGGLERRARILLDQQD